MLLWALRWIIWFSWRTALTLICIYAVQAIIHTQGYLIEFKILLQTAILIILAVRVWMPSIKENKQIEMNEDT